jgi:hypothetical protein
MNALTLTAKSQCTLNKQLLSHIGAKPGDTVLVKKMPDGLLNIQAKATPATSSIMALRGSIASDTLYSDEHIKAAIQQAYVQAALS